MIAPDLPPGPTPIDPARHRSADVMGWLGGWGIIAADVIVWTKGVLPGLGGLVLLAAFVLSAIGYGAPDIGETTVFGLGGVFVIGIGALLLGAVLMLVYRWTAPAFFRGVTLRAPAPIETPGSGLRTERIPVVVPSPRHAAAPKPGPSAAVPAPQRPAPQPQDLFDPLR